MVRPDQKLLYLEVGAEEKTRPDHGYAFSVGCRVVFFRQDEAPAVVADRENALSACCFRRVQPTWTAQAAVSRMKRLLRRGSAKIRVDVNSSLMNSKAACWAASSGGSTCGSFFLVS